MGILQSLFGQQQPQVQPGTQQAQPAAVDTETNPGHGLLFGTYKTPEQEMAQLALFSQLASGRTPQDQLNFAPTLIPFQQAMAQKQAAIDVKNKTVAVLQQKYPDLAASVLAGAVSPNDATMEMFKRDQQAKEDAKPKFMAVNGRLVQTNGADKPTVVQDFSDPMAGLPADAKTTAYWQAHPAEYQLHLQQMKDAEALKANNSSTTNLQKDLQASGLQPGTPDYQKAIMNAHKLSADPSKGNLKSDLETMKAYRGEDPIKNYQVIHNAYQKAVASSKLDTAAGDMSLIYSFMKLNDPTSVVREGEFATAANSGGVDDRIIDIYNKALSGKMLTPEQRQQFLQAAKAQYDTVAQNVNEVNDRYQNLSKDYNINPNRFMIQPEQFPAMNPGDAPHKIQLQNGTTGTIQRVE